MPASFQRAPHLRGAYDGMLAGKELPRLMIVAWDIPGVCDIPAMTAAINAHVRRHDSYHDWFELENEVFVRRAIDDPNVIDLLPVEFGHMDVEQIRTHVTATTPGTLEWGGFTFGIVQHVDHFTFYASADHFYIDGMSAGVIFFDIHLAYDHLRQAPDGAQPATAAQIASYRDYVARQHEKVANLTLSCPEIKTWIEFIQGTGGNWPSFPLPLGDTRSSTKGEFLTVELLDAADTESFDTACRAAGGRFSGGVLACAALAEHDLTGADTYYGFAPHDTRTSMDTMTVGWFAGLFPVTVPLGTGSFPDLVRAAQKSFDSNKTLAGVPFERVLELTTPDQLGIELGARSELMLSFIDVRKIPVADLFEQTNFGTYGDNLSHGGINIWITRHVDKTTVTISFPDNQVARASVHGYIAVLRQAFTLALAGNADWMDAVVDHANSAHGRPVIRL
jgi:mycolipenoyl-CoA---2-(long-chain-fatty acyl)-trehalose mycolipenoyltransferase / long-chain-acyl-CoA---trehalose acyltransferase